MKSEFFKINLMVAVPDGINLRRAAAPPIQAAAANVFHAGNTNPLPPSCRTITPMNASRCSF
jgi:hypothetical protein